MICPKPLIAFKAMNVVSTIYAIFFFLFNSKVFEITLFLFQNPFLIKKSYLVSEICFTRIINTKINLVIYKQSFFVRKS